MMVSVQAKGKIDTISGTYYFVHSIDTGIGKSFLKRLFSRRDLFIGTPDRVVYYDCGDKVHEGLQLIKPVGPFVIRNFPAPKEIFVESLG